MRSKANAYCEVGCGIGLASLVLNRHDADITATEYHPNAEAFLEENTRLNNGRKIPFVRTGWGVELTELGEFDQINGSDLVYEYHQTIRATLANAKPA